MICTLPMGLGGWPSPGKFFAPRPLQLHDFRDRDVLHHSIILQIDGLLFACFRLRLERDVCAQSFGDSFCAAFGPGVSPASTFCGLYMPSVNLLQAVLQSVKAERGYGVFIGPVSCNAWASLRVNSDHRQNLSLLTFTFAGPNSTSWQGIFVSFAFQGKVKRKKPDCNFFSLPSVARSCTSEGRFTAFLSCTNFIVPFYSYTE